MRRTKTYQIQYYLFTHLQINLTRTHTTGDTIIEIKDDLGPCNHAIEVLAYILLKFT